MKIQNKMKKYILPLLLVATTLSFAQKTPAVKDTITKAATKTDTTEKPEKHPSKSALKSTLNSSKKEV